MMTRLLEDLDCAFRFNFIPDEDAWVGLLIGPEGPAVVRITNTGRFQDVILNDQKVGVLSQDRHDDFLRELRNLEGWLPTMSWLQSHFKLFLKA